MIKGWTFIRHAFVFLFFLLLVQCGKGDQSYYNVENFDHVDGQESFRNLGLEKPLGEIVDETAPAEKTRLLEARKSLEAKHQGPKEDFFVQPNPQLKNFRFVSAKIKPEDYLGQKPKDKKVAAAAFLKTYKGLFGIQKPQEELRIKNLTRDFKGMEHLRYDQYYKGIPVFGAQLIVHVNKDDEVTVADGQFVPDIAISTTPEVSKEKAIEIVEDEFEKEGWNLLDKEITAELTLFNSSLIDSKQPFQTILAWQVVSPWATYFVNALNGHIEFFYSNIQTIRRIETYDSNQTSNIAPQSSPRISQYGNNAPQYFNGYRAGTDADVDYAQEYALATYNYYHSRFNRKGYDDRDSLLISNVHHARPNFCGNAAWLPTSNQMVYCDGYPTAKDVAGHEMTHGVIRYTADLIYAFQSGSLNESYADLFGVIIENKADWWILGEDLSDRDDQNPVRNLLDPTLDGQYNPNQCRQRGQPDHVQNFCDCPIGTDNGCVHVNSGIPNKAAALILRTLGQTRTEQIYYRALTTYLIPTSNFADAKNALFQSCQDLIGSYNIVDEHCRRILGHFETVGVGTGRLRPEIYPARSIYGYNGSPPAFELHTRDRRFYIVEVATDWRLLNADRQNRIDVGNPQNPNANVNFISSFDLNGGFSQSQGGTATFQIPQTVWEAFRKNLWLDWQRNAYRAQGPLTALDQGGHIYYRVITSSNGEFNDLYYSTEDVNPNNSKSSAPSVSLAKWHPNGTLIKSEVAAPIYLIENQRLWHIPDIETFDAYRFDMDKVILVSDEEIASYSIAAGPSLRSDRDVLYKEPDDSAIWIRVGGQGDLRPIVSDVVYQSWGFSTEDNNGDGVWDGIDNPNVADAEVASGAQKNPSNPWLLREGTLIKEPNDPRIYVISSGAARPILNEDVYYALFNDYDFSFVLHTRFNGQLQYLVQVTADGLPVNNGVAGSSSAPRVRNFVDDEFAEIDRISPQVSLANIANQLSGGQQVQIGWQVQDNRAIAETHLYYTTDGWRTSYRINRDNLTPAQFNSLQGSTAWIVPNIETDEAVIRLVAYDTTGNTASDYSHMFSIQLGGGNPGCSVPDRPQIEMVDTYQDRYRVQWSDVDNEDYFILQEDTNNQFDSPREIRLNRNNSYELIDQPQNNTYYLRLKAVNDCEESEWSNTYRFDLSTNHYATRPQAVIPQDEANNVPLNTQICWSSSHPDNSPLSYVLKFKEGDADDQTFLGSSLVYQGNQDCYQPPVPLEWGTSYMWNVRVTDEDGSVTESPIFRFTTIGDNSTPQGSITINGGDETTTSFVVNLQIVGQDAESGVDRMSLSNDGENWSEWFFFSEDYFWDLRDAAYGGRVRDNGIYTVYVKLKDARDNISPVYSDSIEKIEGAPGIVTLNGRVYETIRLALNDAELGDTIYLSPGEWHLSSERIFIHGGNRSTHINLPADIHLVGSGWNQTRLVTTTIGYGIVMQEGSSITGLTIDNNTGHGAVIPRGNNLIQHCRITGAGGGGHSGSGLYIQDSDLPLTTVRNTIFDSNYEGLTVSGRNSALRLWSSVIIGNQGGLRWDFAHPDSQVLNTIFAFSGRYCNVVGAEQTLDAMLFSHNNIFQEGPNVNPNSCYNPQGRDGNLSVDPQFVNRANRDYRLRNNSPLINQGSRATGLPFFGNNPEIGAYEYNAFGRIEVTTGHPEASFALFGEQSYEGEGVNWSTDQAPSGLYTINYFPIENHNTPQSVTRFLEPGTTLGFNERYTPDEQGPVGTLEINFGEYATHHSEVTLALLIDDPVAGLGANSQMQFSNNGENWSAVEPYDPIVRRWSLIDFVGGEAAGERAVYARVSDQLGNWSDSITATIQYIVNRAPLIVPDDYATVVDAVQEAQEGDIIWLMPGEHGGDEITIPNGVRIQGSGFNRTILHSRIRMGVNTQIDGVTIDRDSPSVNIVAADNAIVSNNKIINAYHAIELGSNNDTQIRIRNNILKHASSAIFVLSESSPALFQDNVITDSGYAIYSNNNHGLNFFRHNIFHDLEALVWNRRPRPDQPTKLLLERNVRWNVDQIFSDSGVQTGEGTIIRQMIELDPLFVDIANADFRLQSHSPLRHAGFSDSIYQNHDGTVHTLGIEGGLTYNSPPVASLFVRRNDEGTRMILDASGSFDAQDSSEELFVRWDLDEDGQYDTAWQNSLVLEVDLAKGHHTVALQVHDRGYYIDTLTDEFDVLNSAPEKPFDPSPHDQEVNVLTNTVLTWAASDVDQDPLTFDVYFGLGGGQLERVAQNLEEAMWSTPPLNYSTRYEWRVVVRDTEGLETQGPFWSFFTEAIPDRDGDGVPDTHDACPNDPNDAIGDPCVHNDCPDQTLEDEIGDACNHNDCADGSPNDNIGDPCNHDDDGDGIADDQDNCPLVANPQQDDFDRDALGDVCDDDVDGDGVVNENDLCGLTPLGQIVSAGGCSDVQRGCNVVMDVQNHEFQDEICTLIDEGYWPRSEGMREFHPNDPVVWEDEIVALLNVAGMGEEASLFVGGICLDDPYMSYALSRRIVKWPECPEPQRTQLMFRAITEAGRAFLKMNDDSYNLFWQTVQNYDGPDYGNNDRPFWIPNTYFFFAYERGALPDWNEGMDASDMSYGNQVLTKGQTAFILYHMFNLGGDVGDIDVPDHVRYLEHAQQQAGFSHNYDVNGPMNRGDLIGLAVRLMKLNGCFDYPAVIQNPFINIADGSEYIPELNYAVQRGILRNGEGDFRGEAGTWVFNVQLNFTRKDASIWLYRVLRESVRGGLCPEKQSCWTVYSQNKDLVHFQDVDWLANQVPLQATCAYVLEGLPLATVDANGLINTDFAGVAEAEETLVTIYRMLQVEP